MKKLLTIFTIAAFTMSATFVNAQTKTKEIKKTVTTEHLKKDGTTDKGIKEEKKTASVHLKKDGKPDKRFKENKTETKVHLKKDGTPDKRFKENKTTTKKVSK